MIGGSRADARRGGEAAAQDDGGTKRMRMLKGGAWAIVLLCCAGCAATKANRPPLTLLPAQTTDEIVPDLIRIGISPQDWQADATRFAEQAEARRLEFRASYEKSIEDNNHRLSQQYDAIHAAGGLMPALEKEIERLSARIREVPTGERADMERRIDRLTQSLGSLAVCRRLTIIDLAPYLLSELAIADPQAFEIAQGGTAVLAGATALINGCSFGDKPGEVRLVVNQFGGFLRLTPLRWTNDQIEAQMASVTGVLDQDAVLVVIRPDGARAELPVKFLARREIKTLGARSGNFALTGNCSHTTQFDQCVTLYSDLAHTDVLWSIAAQHWSRCCIFSVSGKDEYSVDLRNGWTVFFTSFSQSGGTTCNAVFGNQGGKAWNPVGLPVSFVSPPISSAEFTVPWWVDANCSFVRYFLHIDIVGPAGVPYF